MYIKSINLSNKFLNKKIKMIGWIQNIRKMGSICFLDLRDTFDIVQIIVKEDSKIFENILHLSKETLIEIEGILHLRNKPNKKILTGIFEVLITKLKVINVSKITPFMIKDETDGLEKIRLKYRYLDLRRSNLKKNLIIRSNVLKFIRNFLNKKEILEIETPILSFPTIEGADSFLVKSNNKKNYYFALPQSPQIYKQTLMNGGFDSYYQIARCFRDENLRNDRQPEFTQLDLEICFAKQEKILNLIEEMIKDLWKRMGFQINYKFKRIDYEYSIEKYGTDKPDLRFDLKIEELKFMKVKSNEVARGIWFDGDINKEQFNFLKFEISKITEKKLMINCKSLSTNFDLKEIENIKNKNKSLIAFVAKKQLSNVVLSQVRNILADFLNLKDKNEFKFCWITNPFMFEFSELKNKYVSSHHPFTLPTNEEEFEKDWKNCKSNGYDLVVNGIELGSGSERIFKENIQRKVFKILGMDEKQIEKEFGFFLESMKFGYPPHAGIAIGIDRIIMILVNANSIRDVIAFPKTLNFNCLFSKSPRKK